MWGFDSSSGAGSVPRVIDRRSGALACGGDALVFLTWGIRANLRLAVPAVPEISYCVFASTETNGLVNGQFCDKAAEIRVVAADSWCREGQQLFLWARLPIASR